MSYIKTYTNAMLRGDTNTCVRIEENHGLYGYPPELVCVGLKAAYEGRDPHKDIAEVLLAPSRRVDGGTR